MQFQSMRKRSRKKNPRPGPGTSLLVQQLTHQCNTRISQLPVRQWVDITAAGQVCQQLACVLPDDHFPKFGEMVFDAQIGSGGIRQGE